MIEEMSVSEECGWESSTPGSDSGSQTGTVLETQFHDAECEAIGASDDETFERMPNGQLGGLAHEDADGGESASGIDLIPIVDGPEGPCTPRRGGKSEAGKLEVEGSSTFCLGESLSQMMQACPPSTQPGSREGGRRRRRRVPWRTDRDSSNDVVFTHVRKRWCGEREGGTSSTSSDEDEFVRKFWAGGRGHPRHSEMRKRWRERRQRQCVWMVEQLCAERELVEEELEQPVVEVVDSSDGGAEGA